MLSSFFTLAEEREKIFRNELIQYGVSSKKAVIAAKIIASGQSDELLSQEEIRIVKDARQKWSVRNKRYKP
ncbi:hypothetical protein [Nostoc sp. FACHB-888]|uniref:hypothetical protein n=1 Tax=Nostoc sp. FACHB-888 TaxID=2692842 RepID=UPI001684B0B8|nr:hypothetical protein [Nostoc sp. FACHB-888]MBD2247761.1 hypothetical protein [Nostoc sp. FACHB-888]